MEYCLYDTEKKKEMKKFLKALTKKAFIENDYGKVKHLAFFEGSDSDHKVLNVFVYDKRILVEDVPLASMLNNLDEVYSLRTKVKVETTKVYDNKVFEEHLKDLFLLN